MKIIAILVLVFLALDAEQSYEEKTVGEYKKLLKLMEQYKVEKEAENKGAHKSNKPKKKTKEEEQLELLLQQMIK